MICRLLPLALATALTMLVAPAWAQQPKKMPVVGILVTHAAANDPIFENVRAGLRDYGYEDGRNIRLEIVTAQGQLDRLPGLAQDLVHRSVDVIIAPNEISRRTAQQATSTIPIVSIGFGNDPVTSGLVDSFGRPGGNVTGIYGIYGLYIELDGKRLAILKETLPGVSRVAVFWAAGFGSPSGEFQRAAQSLGLRLELIEIRGPSEAFKTAKRNRAGAVMLLASPIFYVHRARVASLALGTRLPTVSTFDQVVEAGALMSYGVDLADVWTRTAYYIDRLLKGARPSDLPVEQPSKFKLAVNLKTAKALGVAIPESILLRADEVIR